jgi:hypothetical protein
MLKLVTFLLSLVKLSKVFSQKKVFKKSLKKNNEDRRKISCILVTIGKTLN